jgi:hypothetical protein
LSRVKQLLQPNQVFDDPRSLLLGPRALQPGVLSRVEVFEFNLANPVQAMCVAHNPPSREGRRIY